MAIFEAEGLFGFVLIALWLYCIFDVIATDNSLCRNLPKGFWLVIVIILPDVGSLAWLVLGRPQKAGWRPGDTDYRRPTYRRAPSPDDDDAFLSGLSPIVREREEQARLRMWEEQLRRREEELRRKEQGSGDTGTTGTGTDGE